MGLRKRIASLANACLRPFGARLVPTSELKPWDHDFLTWIDKAKRVGKDPNDIGDQAWDDDVLRQALERHYLPYISPASVVLELGPGSGRVTRHVIGRCREMILVDYSRVVCAWLEEYLRGKGRFRIVPIDRPAFPAVEDQSVDMVFANGVFEHIGKDELFFFLEEFRRVLRPGGMVAFNYDNLMSPGGLEWYRRYRGRPGDRCLFRFYHPESIARLAEAAGLNVVRLTTSESRFGFAELQKRAA